MMSNPKFYHECITEYVQTEGHVMQLQIHPINSFSTNQTCRPEFWFKDRHLQEVTQLIKIPLFKRSKAFSTTTNDKPQKDDLYNILSGNTIRLAYTFKKNPARQYFLVMNKRENDADGQFHNFHFKNEKMVIFVCQIEKGVENLLKVVTDTKGLTSSSQQQTVSISSYFSQLPFSADNSHPSNSVDTLDKNKDASDVTNEDTSKKERLKSIVSRVKRLRQKKSRKYQRRVKRNDSEKQSNDNVESSSSEADNGQVELSPQKHSDILKESNHALNSTNDNWIEDLSFNGASLSDSLLDRFILDNNSDGSTSSDENLPYYGISDKCSPSSATGSANQTFNAGSVNNDSSNSQPKSGSLLASPQSSPSKFGNSTHSYPDGVSPSQSGDSKGVKTKSRLKRTSKTSRVKELKDASAKLKISEDGTSSSKIGMSIHDLSPKMIMRIIRDSEGYLRKIFEGKTASWRHKMYKTGGPDRRRLNFHCQFGHLSPKQLESIMEGLFNIFCKKHLKYEDYVSKVMLAEAIIKIHMDIYQISHKEAENMLE